jgi:MOSC domain-containing protein YiiM
MKLVSVNTGLPREVTWHDMRVTTGIFKEPVAGRVALRKLNLDGDRQADLTVHGGEFKAVYCYPIVHYDYWKRELPGRDLPLAIFGENFTIDSFAEDSIHLGDQFSVGSAHVVVTQPRLPCYKLGIRFQADDMVKRFLASARTGFYSPSPAKERSAPATKSNSSPATRRLSPSPKSLACTSQKNSVARTSPHSRKLCK